MPFDPQLIRDDDADFSGELKLPGDLAFMSEQLVDDAARLAAAYPPPKPAVLAVASRPITRRYVWLTRSLAGTALAVGLVTISLVAMNARHQPGKATPAPNSGLVVNHSPQVPTAEPRIPVTPASYLGDASGPELEALMDLWEQDQPKERSLSF
ncbi:MAG: hypothetical protein IAF94_19240 [Pirellulaceae bacterium]|nr:hypothetical protein [Pirellulaceae bacterium]